MKNIAKKAASFLQEGRVIAFATDTVYGLAADACNEDAVQKLYHLKQRQEAKPIAIFVPNLAIAEEFLQFNDRAREIADKFLPGSLTMVLKKVRGANLAKNLNKNDDFLGFRIVESEFIEELFRHFKGPIAVTSANISGEKPAISAKDVANNFQISQNNILLIDGGICAQKVASTVVKIDDNTLEILRQGNLKIL